jgi:hypothetical protein
MDRGHFDSLTRRLAATHSRRAALTTLIGAALFGLAPDPAETAKNNNSSKEKRRRKRDRKRDRKRNRDKKCTQSGGFPTGDRPCCAGLVVDVNGRCAGCSSCAAGQRCVGNQCQCDSQSCPTGCCTAFGTPSGTCGQGSSPTACGTGGALCLTCGGTTPTCTGSSCVCSASAQSCVNGCCDGVACQAGTSNTVCGALGRACTVCGSTQTCLPLQGGIGGACV